MNTDLRKLSSAGLRAYAEPQARRPALPANIGTSLVMGVIRKAAEYMTPAFPTV